MEEIELKKLIKDIQNKKTETQTIELKSCHDGFPYRIYDTLSSFSNQNSGGIIIFGINDNYEIVGVYDTKDVQKKVMECCKQMEPNLRPVLTVCEIENKTVVAAEIPAVEIIKRPVFYAGIGRIKGSYIRTGDADVRMSEYEVYSYESFRKNIQDDCEIVERADFQLFNQENLSNYLKNLKNNKKNLANNVSDEEIYNLMGILNNGKCTLASVLIFSKYPQAYFPELRIAAVSIAGNNMGEIGENDERFIDNQSITGTISEMLESGVEFVRKNSRIKTIIDENGHRRDEYEYPLLAVREVILNALIHRDYSIYTQNIPISIEMYRDRLEIRSPGGLYGYVPIELLGKIHPRTRNLILTNLLEVLKITENRYSGIPTIYRELEKAKLPKPIFEVKHGEFIVTFKNNIYKEEALISSKKDMKSAILEFCKIPKSRDELVAFIGTTRAYATEKYIVPLINEGKIKMSLPEKPKSSKQRFFTVL